MTGWVLGTIVSEATDSRIGWNIVKSNPPVACNSRSEQHHAIAVAEVAKLRRLNFNACTPTLRFPVFCTGTILNSFIGDDTNVLCKQDRRGAYIASFSRAQNFFAKKCAHCQNPHVTFCAWYRGHRDWTSFASDGSWVLTGADSCRSGERNEDVVSLSHVVRRWSIVVEASLFSTLTVNELICSVCFEQHSSGGVY